MPKMLKSFLMEDDGVETMEWFAIVIVAAAMIGIAATCGDKIVAKMSSVLSFL